MKPKGVIAASLLLGVMLLFAACRTGAPPEPPNYYDWRTEPQETIPWPTLADTPWPMYRADPQGTGRTRWPGPRGGSVAWKRFVGGRVGVAVIGPDSTIYFTNPYGQTETGEQRLFLWAVRPDGSVRAKISLDFPPNEPLHSTHTDCQPLVGSDGAIYIGTNNGNFYALEPDGQLRWQFKADAQISTPQLNIDLAGNIYFFDENSTFYALASDGSLRFKAQAPDEMQFAGTGLAFSPDGNTFYTVAYKRDSTVAVWLMAYSLNGEEIWRYQLGKGDFFAIPLVDNAGRIYMAFDGAAKRPQDDMGGVYAFSPDGEIVWKQPFPGERIAGEPTMDHNGQLYVNIGNWLYSFDYDGKQRWRVRLGSIPATQALICDADNVVYFMGDKLYAVNDRGKELWSVDVGANAFFSSSIGYNNMLFFGTSFVPTPAGQRLFAIH
ncbi:MAG: PQQ-binding-like beta-propeller repeat protein [candidate division KSB1 bacterium]|nr:PQQ-binding-like beta-propeller repeat protein [candidate division KSB1 bacterium]